MTAQRPTPPAFRLPPTSPQLRATVAAASAVGRVKRHTDGLRRMLPTVALVMGMILLGCASSSAPSVAPQRLQHGPTAPATDTPAPVAAEPPPPHSAPASTPPGVPSHSSPAVNTAESATADRDSSALDHAERQLHGMTGATALTRPPGAALTPAAQAELFLEFHPHYVIHMPDFGPSQTADESADSDAPSNTDPSIGANDEPAAAPIAAAAAGAAAGEGDAVNPPVVTIDETVLAADAFVTRAFRMHHEWYMLWLKELLVARVAKREAAREGITFSEAEIAAAHERVIEFIKQRARRVQQSFRQHWQSQGYESETAYVAAWRAQVERLLLLERLFFLLDLRLAKVEYSWLVIADVTDRFRPDPAQLAQRLAEQLRRGEITWERAVQQYTSDVQTRPQNGKRGVVVRGVIGVPAIEEWLFSNDPGAISDPIPHPIHGYVIARVDRVEPGNASLTYAQARPEIERRLAQQQGIPGTRVTSRDTFIWLERIIGTGRYAVRSFAPIAEDGVPRIAQVDAEPITVGDFVAHAFESKPDWARQVLSEVIVFHIAELEAAREGLRPTEPQIASGVAAVTAFLRESSRSRGETFDDVWQNQGYPSLAAFQQAVLAPLVRENLQLERLVFLHDRRIERREVWHILTQAENYAVQARKLIVEQGQSFEDVAQSFSQHAGTRRVGGLIGVVPRDMFGADFSEPTFRLRPNEISAPIRTEQGWHIVRVTRIFPARPRLTWRDAQAEIDAALAERGNVAGQRIAAADTYRWIAAIRDTNRYRIIPHFPR